MIVLDIDLQGEAPTNEIIKLILSEHAPMRQRMIKHYNRYKANDVPIFHRKLDDTKINNTLNVDMYSLIVDQKIGYLMGRPVSYQYRSDHERDAGSELLERFRVMNNFADLNVETVKYASICGYAALLNYIAPTGEEKVMNLKPFEVAFVSSDAEKVKYALRYFDANVIREGKVASVKKVEFYDSQNIYFFEEKDGKFLLTETMLHLFDDVPVIMFKNNDELLGDCWPAENLIDAYDRTLSDMNSEIEQFRLAYLAITGGELEMSEGEDGENPWLDMLKQTGIMELPQGAEAKFITKQLAAEYVEKHLDRLEEDIFHVSSAISFKDKHFSGNLSGVALRYKIQNLENKTSTTERKFSTGLRELFRVIATAWKKKNYSFNYLDVNFTFSRTFPKYLNDEAEANAKLMGTVSERTRLAQLSFIEDPDKELELMEEEKKKQLELATTSYEFPPNQEGNQGGVNG